jgi:hypothetical protein
LRRRLRSEGRAKAPCWGVGSLPILDRSGRSSWWTAAKLQAVSDSTAAIRSTCASRADSAVHSISADLPMPGSPRRTSVRLIPRPQVVEKLRHHELLGMAAE